MATLLDYQLAAGHNNAAGLVNVENMTSGGYTLHAPTGLGTYSPGEEVVRGDGSITYDGQASVIWEFDLLEPTLLEYLSTTFCAGGYTGLVTVRTRTRSTGYANYNARMIVPTPREIGKVEALGFPKVEIAFVRMVAI